MSIAGTMVRSRTSALRCCSGSPDAKRLHCRALRSSPKHRSPILQERVLFRSCGNQDCVTRAAGATRYAAALVGAALLVAGCGDSKPDSKSDGVANAATQTQTPTATAPPTDAEQIQSLLKERARRIQNGDPLALVDTSTGPQAIRDKREANSARALKLEGVMLESRAASIQGR